jgi:iron complex outermembrane receptor protein
LCILLVSPPIPAQEGTPEGSAPPSVDEATESERPDLSDLEDEDLLRPEFSPEDAAGIEEIKVTTTQSELTAQDEAVSVTQFSAADIQDFRIQNISDLSDYTPNLEINTAFAASNPTVFIRGIGLKDYNANSSGSVAIYTDGIYVNSGAGQLFQMFDIASIEVLRGPQGSESARNATAGAIRVNSNKPDGEFSGFASLSYGNFNLLELETAFGFPIIGDIVTARIAGAANFMDGYMKNECANTAPYAQGINESPECDINGDDFAGTRRINLFPVAVLGDFNGLKKWQNNAKNWALRGLIRIQPTDNVDVLTNIHWGQNRSDSLHLQMKGVQGQTAVNNVSFSEDSAPRFDLDPYVGYYDQDGKEFLDVFGASVTADLDFGLVHVTSITGYESNDRLVEDEGDATPDVLLGTDWDDEAWQVSQELRVDGDGENYTWSLGGYFLYEEVQALNIFKQNTLDYINQEFDQTLLTFAPYVHGSWEFNDFWSLEMGARYNWEQKVFELGTTVETWIRKELAPGIFATGWDHCCEPAGIPNVALPPVEAQGRWAAPTGDFTVNFEPLEDVKLYVKYARGMKGGHFNASSFTDDQSLEPVEPEFVHSGEFGIKSQVLDGALMFNSAVFYYDYDDLQVFDIANEVGKPAVQQLLSSDATALGVEAEIVFRPHPDLLASLGFGWLDATFGRFLVPKQITPPFARGGNKASHGIFDYTGNPLIAAPRFSLTGNVEYTIPLGRFGSLAPGFDFSFKDRVALDPSNKTELSQPSYWLLNARLSYTTPDERISIQGWVRNLTEKLYLIDAFDQSIDTKQILYVYSEPRFFGFTLTLDW